MLAKVRAMIEATPLEGFVACARALQSYDATPALPGLAMPVQVVVGEKDGALPGAMRAMAAQIPGARFAEIAAAGHLVNLEQPVAFRTVLEHVLSGA